MRRLLLLILLVGLPWIPATGHAAEHAWQTDPRTRIVRVAQDAVVTIAWDALAASGWDLATIPLSQIHVRYHGQPIPLQISAAGLAFMAKANPSRYDTVAAYWIGIGVEPGPQTILPANPTTSLRWDPDQIYQPAAQTLRGDAWFAGELRGGGTPLTLHVTLPAMLPAGTQLVLEATPLELRAGHQIMLSSGSTMVGSFNWDDSRGGPRTLTLTTAHDLPAGDLALALDLASSGADLVLIDELAIPDARIDLPTIQPALELPKPLAIPARADQVMISHLALIPALQPLIEAKQARGQQIALADVLAIYDQYGWGERDPQAIRAFLQALALADRLPDSVLLVGGGTARLRVAPGEADSTMIPPLLVVADPTFGEIACETCYTRLDAINPLDDALPNLPIGRLPANTQSDLAIMVAKTVQAFTPPPGSWRGRMLLVADNDAEIDGQNDPAGPFAPLLTQIATGLPELRATDFVYAPGQPSTTARYANAPALRTELLHAWDAGAALVAYAGHASPWQWAWTGPRELVPHLLTRADAVRTNHAQLPILLSLTCLSGAFANPTLSPIDAELLHQPGGGIVAALSPTGSGVATAHRDMLVGLLPALRQGQTLGIAHLASLAALHAAQGHDPASLSYAILGDPDVRLPAPAGPDQLFLPNIVRS